MEAWEKEAEHFLKFDTEFRLGFLPSEARNPRSMHLDEDFRRSTREGVRTLLDCDRALLPYWHETLRRKEYAAMIRAMREADRVIVSGCGATGRLAILLESAWREATGGDGKVVSLMTGGDFALIRSVEHFEDHGAVGAKQLEELNFTAKDMLIGITATGETASILGSAQAAAECGARVFMLICVPAETARSRLERCRALYTLPNVTVIDMPIGGMALTGSTRMQSSTIELLAAASALERAADAPEIDCEAAFAALLDGLAAPENIAAMADMIDFEYETYRRGGLIDYLPDDLVIDVLSDTTERSPTFMVPPFKPLDDLDAPEPWAMVRMPEFSTQEAWQRCLKRDPRCIAWSREEYEKAGLEALIRKGLPKIDKASLLKIPLGGPIPGRTGAVATAIRSDRDKGLAVGDFTVRGAVVPTMLRLFEHLRLKLVLNIVSTGTMVRLGRVRSNYMIHLAISNKKLIDRASRIIAELCHLPYEEACRELFHTCAMQNDARQSPVAETIRRLGH